VVNEGEYFRHGIHLDSSDTVVDVGGNIGTFAVTASRMVAQGRVITIEPDPSNLRLLAHNLALNNCTNVSVCEAAITDHQGSVNLRITAGHQGAFSSTVPEWATDPVREITVRAITLADLFAMYHIDQCALLKLDCEGAEFPILASLTSELANRISMIAMEYHLTEESQLSVLLSRCNELGFAVLHEERSAMVSSGHLFLKRR
jgi:FkbM family methyltransferase